MKLLVVKPSALGDVAHSLPAVVGLKELHPDWEITWLIDEDYAPLLRMAPAISHLIKFPRRKWRNRPAWGEMLRWLTRLGDPKFDAVLDLQGLARSGLMTWMSGSPRRIGLVSAREGARLAYTERVRDQQVHAVERYLEACRHLGGSEVELAEKPCQKPLPLAGLPSSYVVLHAYSNWETKLWPWQKWGELVEAMPNTEVVLVGQGDPFPVLGEQVTDLRNQTNLRELLCVLANARGVISTDSGPAHLAALFGTPILCLFGATDPARTAPRFGKIEILSKDLSCQPCLQRQCPSEDVMKCMRDMSIGEVLEAWKKIDAMAGNDHSGEY